MKKNCIYVIIASLLYGAMPLIVKQILKLGVNAQMVVNLRFLFSAIFLLIYFLITKKSFYLAKRKLFQVIVFGVSGYGITGLLLTLSYQYLSSGMATVFHFTAPLFVNLILFVIFKEKPTLKIILSTCCAVVGMIMIFNNSTGISTKGVLLAASSGFTYAIYMVSVQKSDLKYIDSLITVFYITLCSGISFSIISLFQGDFIFPTNLSALCLSLLVALFCGAIPMVLITVSVQKIGSIKTSTLNMLEPVTSVILGTVILHDEMNLSIFLGIIIVLFSILQVVTQKNTQK